MSHTTMRRRYLALILLFWIIVGVILSFQARSLGGKLVYNDEKYIPEDLESIRAARLAGGRVEASGGPTLVVVLNETRFDRLNTTARLLGEALGEAGFNVSVSNAATVFWSILRNYTSTLEEAKAEFNQTLDKLAPAYAGLEALDNISTTVTVLAAHTYGAAEAYLQIYCSTGDPLQASQAAYNLSLPALGEAGASLLVNLLNNTIPHTPNCNAARITAEDDVHRFIDSMPNIPDKVKLILKHLSLDNYDNRTFITSLAADTLHLNLSNDVIQAVAEGGAPAGFAALLGPGMEWIQDYLPMCLENPEWRNRSLVRFHEWFITSHPPPRYPEGLSLLGSKLYDSLLSPTGYSATYIVFHGEAVSGPAADKAVSTVNNTLIRLGLHPIYAGSVAILAANYRSIGSSVEMIDLVTIVLVAAILIATLGGAGVPATVLAAVGISIASTLGLMTLLADFIDFHYITRLVVMPIAVGLTVDYTIYTLFRYVEEKSLKAHNPLRRAWLGASRALLVGGISVILGFSSYNAGETGYMDNVGTALALAAVVALAVSLSFSPSLIGLFEKAVFWPRPPRHKHSSRLSGWARRSYRKPLLYLGLATLVVLGAIAVLYYSPPEASSLDYLVPPDSFAHEGQSFYDTVFPPSRLDTLILVYNGTIDQHTLIYELRSRGIPVDWYRSPAPRILVVGIDAPVYSGKALDYIDKTRNILRDKYPGVLVGGEAAIRKDLVAVVQDDFYLRVLPAIVIIVTAYMALALGSITMPIRLLATVAWSALVGLGITTLALKGSEGLYWLAPVEVIGISLALGVDYDVFIIGRIAEKLQEGETEEDAVAYAIGSTGLSVTVCGLVLGTAFLSLLIAPQPYLKQIGLAIGTSILLDTFIVRPILVPATLGVLGKANWWPGKGLLYNLRQQ